MRKKVKQRPATVGRPPGVLMGDERACTRKKAMEKPVAVKAAARRRRATGEPIYAYECEECGAWHIGHSEVKDRKMKGEV